MNEPTGQPSARGIPTSHCFLRFRDIPYTKAALNQPNKEPAAFMEAHPGDRSTVILEVENAFRPHCHAVPIMSKVYDSDCGMLQHVKAELCKVHEMIGPR